MAAVMASPPIFRRLVCRASSIPTSTQSPPRPSVVPSGGGRRHCLFLLTATLSLKAIELPSAAEDIPLFGLRKKIQKAEEVAEEVVKEGIQEAEKQIESAEKQIDAAETAFLTVDAAIQAGAVAGAEVLGVVVASSIVNGILGTEKQ